MHYKTIEGDKEKEIKIRGSFTFRDHDEFFEIISLIKGGTTKKVIFNLSECDFIDSAALGMFVIAHDEASSKNVRLSVKGAKGKVREIMYAARFDSLYDFLD